MHHDVRRTGLTITNPLVLYRSLLATKKISPDPAQHRLAIYLQKLYERLKDYEPTVEYGRRLTQLGYAIDDHGATSQRNRTLGRRGIWNSLLAEKEKRENLALTRVLTSHEEALRLDSPQGLMLHGEVGTGKSMLIDLFAESLPHRKKRRWHFDAFMLETMAQLEKLRVQRSAAPSISATDLSSPLRGLTDDHSLLRLARDVVRTSPILFLDEFQLPDRATSKIMSTLLTGFFQLGGVLIATSNRIPEELANAAGVEYAASPSRFLSTGWKLGLSSTDQRGHSDAMFAGRGELAGFLELLKARCDVWEMEGSKDYRRGDADKNTNVTAEGALVHVLEPQPDESFGSSDEREASPEGSKLDVIPRHYFVRPRPGTSEEDRSQWQTAFKDAARHAAGVQSPPTTPIPWELASLRVYGRSVSVPRQHNGVSCWTFWELCGDRLGPADYLTLCSTYHTLILTDVPILNLLQKNEARRFITLLDALYETRSRLLVSAAAGPDDVFFPEEGSTKAGPNAQSGRETSNASRASRSTSSSADGDTNEDATYAETFAEAYQDATAPFRPNIASYGSAQLAPDALEDDPPNRARRAAGETEAMADESGHQRHASRGPDFLRTDAFTGEDERFAYKRARSRLWELCSTRWWDKGDTDEGVASWWRPLDRELRRWEGNSETLGLLDPAVDGPNHEADGRVANVKDEGLFRHGASPFRTHTDPPPKISWTHIWGTMKWGKRAGNWGKGVEGFEARKNDKEED